MATINNTGPGPFVIFMLILCGLTSCSPHPKIVYDIPADYPQTRRQQLIEICDKGKELYKIHCSGCHGIFTRGKDSIPNFSTTQLDNYNSRFMMADPRNHAVARKMSREQLNQVLTFLRYKKTKQTTDTLRKK